MLSTCNQTAKLGSLVEVQDSDDPEGLRVFYYLVQDLKVRFTILLQVTHPLTPLLFAIAVPNL